MRRSLGHRKAQAVLVVVVSALISGTTVFATGYQYQVQQALVDATLGADGPSNAWSVTSEPGVNMLALLPRGSQRLTEPPVAGRVAGLRWRPERPDSLEGKGTLQSRDDVCTHLVMVSGRCPSAADEVAISTADAGAFGVHVLDRLVQATTIERPATFLVTGVYQPSDPQEPYWFGTSPIGRSEVYAPDEQPRADALITVPETFQDQSFQETLDVRINGAAVSTTDLDELRSYTSQLAAAAAEQGRLTTRVPQSLDRIALERGRAVAGLTFSLAQLAVLVGVVLALLASVELSAQRGELGLGRLRGEPVARLRGLVVARWAAVVVTGWLLGWIPALGLLAMLAERLPGQRGLLFGPALIVVPLAVLLTTIAVMAPPAQALLAQPVIGLLRSAPAAARDGGGRQLMVDVALLVLTVSGVLVAVQVGTTSVLGLLVPSLLAVGLAVVLFRLLVRLADQRRRRLGRTGLRPTQLLTATLLVRLRGLRMLTVGTTVAVAFAVFAVQLYVIGFEVRQHDAQVRTGAATVLQVTGEPAAVLHALAQVDPGHDTADARMTAVVVTRRSDARAPRGMFVEPAAFARIAFGADRTTGTAGWQRIAAPQVAPVRFAGSTFVVQVGRHGRLGRTSVYLGSRQGRRADLSIDYVSPLGQVVSLPLGSLSLNAEGGEQFRRPIECEGGCRLLRITLEPDGPMAGPLPLTVFGTESAGIARPLDLGPVDQWPSVPTTSPDDRLGLKLRGNGMVLDATTEGLPLTVQSAWVPLVLPVLAASDVAAESDPTVAAPDGSPLAIDPVVRAVDAVPGQLAGVVLADLGSALRASGGEAASTTAVQIWVSGTAADRRADLERALVQAGSTVVGTQTVAEAMAANRITASALSGQIAPALAALACGLAALGITLTVSAQRPVLGRDLAALRVAGVRSSTLRRGTTLAYLVPSVLAVLAGAAAGAVGCGLVVGGLPMLADPQPAIRPDLRLRPVPLAGCLVLAAGVLATAVLLSVRRLYRDSESEQL